MRKLTLGVFSFLLSNHWFTINAGEMYWSTNVFFGILRSTDLTMGLFACFQARGQSCELLVQGYAPPGEELASLLDGKIDLTAVEFKDCWIEN